MIEPITLKKGRENAAFVKDSLQVGMFKQEPKKFDKTPCTHDLAFESGRESLRGSSCCERDSMSAYTQVLTQMSAYAEGCPVYVWESCELNVEHYI